MSCEARHYFCCPGHRDFGRYSRRVMIFLFLFCCALLISSALITDADILKENDVFPSKLKYPSEEFAKASADYSIDRVDYITTNKATSLKRNSKEIEPEQWSSSNSWTFPFVNAYDDSPSSHKYRLWYSSNVPSPSQGGWYSSCLSPGEYEHLFVPTSHIRNGTIVVSTRVLSCTDDSAVYTRQVELYDTGIDMLLLFRDQSNTLRFWDVGYYTNAYANIAAMNAIHSAVTDSHIFTVGNLITYCLIDDGENSYYPSCAFKSSRSKLTISSGSSIKACSIKTNLCTTTAISSGMTINTGETLWVVAITSKIIYIKSPSYYSPTAAPIAAASEKKGLSRQAVVGSILGACFGALAALLAFGICARRCCSRDRSPTAAHAEIVGNFHTIEAHNRGANPHPRVRDVAAPHIPVIEGKYVYSLSIDEMRDSNLDQIPSCNIVAEPVRVEHHSLPVPAGGAGASLTATASARSVIHVTAVPPTPEAANRTRPTSVVRRILSVGGLESRAPPAAAVERAHGTSGNLNA